MHITSNPESVDIFNSINLMIGNKQGSFITHIHDTPVFFIAQAREKLALLFKDWKKAQEQVVATDFSFEIAFARVELKHAHTDPIKASNADLKVSKRKAIYCKYRTRSWKRRIRGNQ